MESLIELRAGTPVHAAGRMLVPIEERRVIVEGGGKRVFVRGELSVAAVVIVERDGARAVDAAGAWLDLDALRQRVAGLQELLRDVAMDRGPMRDVPP